MTTHAIVLLGVLMFAGYLAIGSLVLVRELRVAGREKARVNAPITPQTTREVTVEGLIAMLGNSHIEWSYLELDYAGNPKFGSLYRDRIKSARRAIEAYLADPTSPVKQKKPEPPKQTVRGAVLWASIWPAWLAVGLFGLAYDSGIKQGEKLIDAQRRAKAAEDEVKRIIAEEGLDKL